MTSLLPKACHWVCSPPNLLLVSAICFCLGMVFNHEFSGPRFMLLPACISLEGLL